MGLVLLVSSKYHFEPLSNIKHKFRAILSSYRRIDFLRIYILLSFFFAIDEMLMQFMMKMRYIRYVNFCQPSLFNFLSNAHRYPFSKFNYQVEESGGKLIGAVLNYYPWTLKRRGS